MRFRSLIVGTASRRTRLTRLSRHPQFGLSFPLMAGHHLEEDELYFFSLSDLGSCPATAFLALAHLEFAGDCSFSVPLRQVLEDEGSQTDCRVWGSSLKP